MYDSDSTSLIQESPHLEGLNTRTLPDFLTQTFAQIAAARISFGRGEHETPEELDDALERIKRLAFTNEALVAVLPEREDRAAAAFVSASAHNLYFNARNETKDEATTSYLRADSISSDVSAMLLFMVSEATADASEISKSITSRDGTRIENALLEALCNLARGKLRQVVSATLPDGSLISKCKSVADGAVQALYLETLKGVHELATIILNRPSAEQRDDPTIAFKRVRKLSIGRTEEEGPLKMSAYSSFSGPGHLASLLIALSGDLLNAAVTRVPYPKNIPKKNWDRRLQFIAMSRPYLWKNHRMAIDEGYLDQGVSSAIGFPTGAGKSTLAELKISTALLLDKDVVFLAPTHALVDQTANSLKKSFPDTSVQREGGCQHLGNKIVRSSTERSSIAVYHNQNAKKKLPSPPRGGSSHYLSYA